MYSDGNSDFAFSAVEEPERIRVICTLFSVFSALPFQKAVPCCFFFLSQGRLYTTTFSAFVKVQITSSISVKETEELLLWWSNQSKKMGRTFETRKGAVFGDKYPDRG